MGPISTLTTMTSQLPHSDFDHHLVAFDLPLGRRGHFFKDTFFENAHQQFNSTVRRILQRWGETDFLDDPKLCHSDILSRYRQLRTHNLKEEDQAVTVSCDSDTQRIVMDVHDFVSGELKVKVGSERELVVEGRTETKTGDLSISSNSFCRRFYLSDNTDIKAVTAVLSDDGILTITAPRKAHKLETGHIEVPITREGMKLAEESLEGNTKATSCSTSKNTEMAEMSSCKCREQQGISVPEIRGHIIPIQVDTTQEGQSSTTIHTTDTSKREAEEKSSLNTKVESAVKNISETIRRAQKAETVLEPSSPRPLFVPPALSRRSIPITTSSLLPITKKGRFYDDEFFTSIRQDFQNAVNNVLGRWGESNTMDIDLDAPSALERYRKLRERSLAVDNQAVTVTTDQSTDKIVMDVHNFLGGEVKVKVGGEKEVAVEGRTETKTGDWSISSNTFCRRFTLPVNSDVKAMSAALSDDGILTITAPRKTNSLKDGSTIPIKVEGEQRIKVEPATPSTPESAYSPISITSPTCPSLVSISSFPNQHSSLDSTHNNSRVSESAGTLVKENKSSQTKQKSSLVSNQREQIIRPGSMMLPITTRGLFFGDSFFKNTWQDFQEAVRDVVSNWGNSSSDDDLARYTTLRTLDMKNENQAVKSTEEDANYKIVVDVQDFMRGGNITVKAVGNQELVVEGDVEQEEGGTKLKKQFYRRFVLPHDIYSESVSSVMSADGVLTITAPKKLSTVQLKEVIVPVAIEEGIHRTDSLNQIPISDIKSELVSHVPSPLPATSVHQQSMSRNVTSESSEKGCTPREHIIPVSVEESHSPMVIETNEKRQAEEMTHTLSHTQDTATSEAHVQKIADSRNSNSESTMTHQSEQGSMKLVPITHKGAFLSDSFFDDARQRFKAITKLSNIGHSLASSHRLLRRNFWLNEQEAHVEEDSRALKVILDVSDFIGGEVKVGVESGHLLVVEGQTSCQEGTSSSSRNFRRVFSLPPHVESSAINPALSSDGVLTIIVPKLHQLSEATTETMEMSNERSFRQESLAGNKA